VTIPKALLARIGRVTAKRPKTVLDHIIRHGQITTQELKDLYGYNHPPRAARDVREQGIALETVRVVGSDGRKIAAYRLAAQPARRGMSRGRVALSKELKRQLVERDGPRCQVCWKKMERRYLQIDHRVPYEIADDLADPESHPEDFMLVCGPCNRAKSWSCEHCANRQSRGLRASVCRSCYWARPGRYTHVATTQQKQTVLTWTGKEGLNNWRRLAKAAKANGLSLADYILELLASAQARGRIRRKE